MLAVLLSLVARLDAPVAAAEPVLVDLEWSAPAECPDAAAVHAAIGTLVPEHPAADEVPPRAHASVEREGSDFVLHLDLVANTGKRSRELRARACASLVDAVAMEVALLIEAERAAAAAAVVPTPAPVREPTTVTTTRTSSPAPAARRLPHWRVRVGALVGARVVENSFVAPTLGAASVGRYWAAMLDVAVWLPGFVPLPGRTDEGSRISLVAVTLSGCGRWSRGRFAVAGCGGLEVGAQLARGIGLDDSRAAAEPSVAFVVAPQVDIAAHRLVVVSIGPWLRLPVLRPGVRVDGVGELFRAPPWSLGGALRLEFEIPGRNRGRRGM
jgi:hypothetical protein